MTSPTDEIRRRLEAACKKLDIQIPKDCPFCGGVPAIIARENLGAMIECTNCSIEGPEFEDHDIHNRAFNAAAAVAHWNKRTSTELDAERAKVEAMRAEIDEALQIVMDAPELNMSNYDEDEVCALNDAMNSAHEPLARAAALSRKENEDG